MEHIEERETSQERPNTEETNPSHQDGNRYLRIATVVVCIFNFIHIIAIAVLVGILIGWYFSIHCFVLCLLIPLILVLTVKAKTKLEIKRFCWGSCSTLILVLMTTFTLLTRQAYYHPSSHIEPKWVLFSIQLSIIPLVLGILVMYECNFFGIYYDKFILMIVILDFADTWAMASLLAQHEEPFIKEKSPLEITMQFFCSFSFIIFPVLMYKNIAKSMIDNEDPAPPAQIIVKANSQLNQNIPFFVIRMLILNWYGFLDFDYSTKNVISVILWFLDCYQGCTQVEPDE